MKFKKFAKNDIYADVKAIPKSPDERCDSSDIAIYNICIKNAAGI